MSMTWEAFRLTSKSPSEVLHVLGPHGVDDLVRKAMDATWREYPAETRTYEAVKKRVIEVFARNLRHWASIKKPTPTAFFENLLPYTADGHVRQAMVLTWMMLPRAGGRDFKEVLKIVQQICNRNLAAWDADHRTFTGQAKTKPKKSPKSKPEKPAAKAKPKRAARKSATAKPPSKPKSRR